MGRAVDTIGAFSTQAGAGAFPQALAAFPGDSLITRGTVSESKARLNAILYQSNATGQEVRLIPPRRHDNVTGITIVPGANPALFALPTEASIEINEQDTLTLQGSCAGAFTITAGLVIDYDNVRGTSADLYRWGDIGPDIRSVKVVQVALNAIAVGAWTDTLITASENQLHADRSYAVLGYDVAPALCMVGIKGVATGNLRMCGPGSTASVDVSDYFVQMGEKHQRSYIPVFQANDRNAFFVSAANGAAVGGGAATVSLIVAELKSKK